MGIIILIVALTIGLGFVYKHALHLYAFGAWDAVKDGTEDERKAVKKFILSALNAYANAIRKMALAGLIGGTVALAILFLGDASYAVNKAALWLIAMGTVGSYLVWRQRLKATPGANAVHWPLAAGAPAWRRTPEWVLAPSRKPTPMTTSYYCLFAFGFATFIASQFAESGELAVAGVTRNRADTISANGVSLSVMNAPRVQVENAGEKPSVKLDWDNIPGNAGYRIERRELRETTFQPIAAGDLGAGITHWEDTTKEMEYGKTYFYRLLVLYPGLSPSKPSEEVRADLVKKIAPVPSASVTASTKAASIATQPNVAVASPAKDDDCYTPEFKALIESRKKSAE